jgi:hypothetical protein
MRLIISELSLFVASDKIFESVFFEIVVLVIANKFTSKATIRSGIDICVSPYKLRLAAICSALFLANLVISAAKAIPGLLKLLL